MAQVDTGLGWSAKDSWLMAGSGVIATIPGGFHWNIAGFETQQIPVTPSTQADVVASGLLEYDYISNGARYRNYLGANKPGAIMAIFHDGQLNPATTVIYVPDNTYEIYSQRLENDSYQGGLSITTNWYTTTVGSDTVTYWAGQGSGINLDPNDFFIPQFPMYSTLEACAQAGWAHVVQGTGIDFSKDNAGYAVTCIANWYTTNGTLITSPVLISSDPSIVEMSCTSTSFNFARASFLYDGKRFYMGFWDAVDKTFESTIIFADLTQFGAAALEKVFNLLRNGSFANILLTAAPPDPYEEEGGDANEEGGDGEEPEDDENGIEVNSDFPSAINTGFCRIYCPTDAQLRDLSNYLWSNSYDLTQVKKLFSNPMDSVIGLSAVPIRLSGTSVNFSLGGVVVPDMTLPMVSQQRYTYYMGGITVKERWGSYLDYDPYTKFSIFLPFIGMRELSTDDIMGKQVMLYYDFDILSGICTARLQAGKHCLYEWGGSCALQLPINARNWDSVFNTAVGAVSGIVSAASGGSAPLVAGSVASAALQSVSMKPRIDKSGNVSGASGWLGQMTPYLIRTTPEAYIAGSQNRYIGYPSYMSISLGALTGYNEIESVHLENIPATGDELSELESILKGGAIF